MELEKTYVYETEVELINQVTVAALDFMRNQLEAGEQFHLTLTGGALGVAIAKEIAKGINIDSETKWLGLNVWWSDERFVPMNSPDRNDLEFCNVLDPGKGVSVHRAEFDGDVEGAAARLDEALTGIEMDLIILGMGSDGHVASLFPGKIHELETKNIFAVHDSPKPPAQRVTFSLRKINRAKEIWLIATGDAKADALTGLVNEDKVLPASHIKITRLLADSKAYPH